MRHAVAVRSRDAGFTMVEVMIAMMILTVAMTGLLATIIPASRLIMVNRETTIAMTSAMAMIEYMSDPDLFPELFVSYNRKTGDDPDGAGTAPGPNFAVAGLNPTDWDPDGMVGEIYFPTFYTTAGDVETEELREDVLDPQFIIWGIDVELGMPRDLGDLAGGVAPGVIDADDHAGDYYLLPVVVQLEWTGISGVRSLRMSTLLAER